MSRGKTCARQIDMGPGSCSYWWSTCPADVAHCFVRHVREHGTRDARGNMELDRDGAEAWAKARDAARAPQGKLL